MIDLVTVLDVTVGEDPVDEQTRGAAAHIPETYRHHLIAEALEGARLGLLIDYVQEGGEYTAVSQVVREATGLMTENGAEIVEIEIEGLEELRTSTSVINYEFRAGLNEYLVRSNAPVKSLAEILETGQFHPALEDRFRRSQDTDATAQEYFDRLERRVQLAQRLVGAMTSNDLDALVYPTLRVKPNFVGERQSGSLCHIAAHSGLPAISLPAGFTADGVPVGIELLARPFEEGRLIELGFGWEQAAMPRQPPALTPSLKET
jgi:Asp-tRNA(Asn)/Glu-tRNA(Gln) amidotransferase A subunit family amidase